MRRRGWPAIARATPSLRPASPGRISSRLSLPSHLDCRGALPRKGHRVGLRIVLFEACSAFTRVTACTLALSPIRDTHPEGFSYFVTSIAAPVASGWSVRRVGLAPTGKRRLSTAHTHKRHPANPLVAHQGDITRWAKVIEDAGKETDRVGCDSHRV